MACKSDINYAGPTGREQPGEHWNARILREQAQRQQVGASVETRTEYGVRGTMYRHGKWAERTDTPPGLSDQMAREMARILNDSLQRASREPDVQVVKRTIYVGEWAPTA